MIVEPSGKFVKLPLIGDEIQWETGNVPKICLVGRIRKDWCSPIVQVSLDSTTALHHGRCERPDVDHVSHNAAHLYALTRFVQPAK